MNFVAQLEDHLRDLGAEARKNHPGVKEASERAVLKLRSLQNAYVSAVRRASANGENHPSTSMFRSSDLLHPFLLAANYPNASPRLLEISFKAMQLLMEADAIFPGDGMNLVRVWMIQAQVVVSYSSKDVGGILGNNTDTTLTGSKVGGGSSGSFSDTSSHGDSAPGRSISGAKAGGSWFGSLLSSAPATKAMSTAMPTKMAVSSSHGQAGSGHLNSKDLEKLALDILRCLLQLLELRDLPVPKDQWIQSISLCCLLCLPSRQTVRQAAHSTLPQVLNLLFKTEQLDELRLATWNDLLVCAGPSGPRSRGSLNGGFSNCRLGEKDAPQPPSPSLSLDLMATLLKETPTIFPSVGKQTFEVLLDSINHQVSSSGTTPIEFLKLLQCSLVVIQTQHQEWAGDCQKVILSLLSPISIATDAVRKHADFEDGFIYKVPDASLVPSTATIETLRILPPTLLWKAAICMDQLKTLVNDKTLRPIWKAEEILLRSLETVSDFCTIGASCQSHMNLVILACRQKGQSLTHVVESLTSITLWKSGKGRNEYYVLGDALLIGIRFMIKLIECVEAPQLDSAFAPSVSVLQHYLKRFPASGAIVEMALEGYFSLAQVSLKQPTIRHALLTSLCKLSLPHWGSHDPACKLQDHNIAVLICLLNVIHRFYNDIEMDWNIIIQTFQELSPLAITSTYLSDSAYVGALSISAVYPRLTAFSTCFSDDSIVLFVEALGEVSSLDSTRNSVSETVLGAELSSNLSVQTRSNTKDDKDNLGRAIMNIGVRAIYGSNDNTNSQVDDVPLAARTKSTYSEDFKSMFLQRLAGSKYPIRLNSAPFSIMLIADVVMANIFRQDKCRSHLLQTLCQLANRDGANRRFLMDTVAMVIVSQLSGGSSLPTSLHGPGRVVHRDPRQNQYLAAETEDDESHATTGRYTAMLEPLCESIRETTEANAAEIGIEALHTILENCGHQLDEEAWRVTLRAIQSLPSLERAAPEWASSCIVGFRCLKLIIDDFIDQTDSSRSTRETLLDCCVSFGSSAHDVNTSLTAIGFVWSVADKDTEKDSVSSALEKLVLLSSDARSEVRNCAVNTFFSCVVGSGEALSADQWRNCFQTMVFKIFESFNSAQREESTEPRESLATFRKLRYRVSIHHSRDSADKQWIVTQTLVLRGLSRVLRGFFDTLLSSMDSPKSSTDEIETPWFEDVWNRILSWSFDAARQAGGRDTVELRVAGVELLVLSAQLSCSSGMHAAVSPARVGTRMEVVNGALRNVGSPARRSSAAAALTRERSEVTELWRENLFLDAFDVLDSFRVHLENTSLSNDPSSGAALVDQTQAQVLNAFAVEMGKLFECCREDEFDEVTAMENSEYMERIQTFPRLTSDDNDPLILRFVTILWTVARLSSSSPNSRYLSQAQRTSLEVFRNMVGEGSAAANLILREAARGVLFKNNNNTTDTENDDYDILGLEAVKILEQAGLSKDSASAETTIVVVSAMLSDFLENVVHASKQDYTIERLASMVISAVQRLEDFEVPAQPSTKWNLVDTFWKQLFDVLSFLLLKNKAEETRSVTDAEGSGTGTVQDKNEYVISMIRLVGRPLPNRFRGEWASMLTSAMLDCLDAPRQQNSDAKGRQDRLDLFEACYAGTCRLDPSHEVLTKVTLSLMESASSILLANNEAIQEGEQAEDSPLPLLDNPDVQACVLVCEVLLRELQALDRGDRGLKTLLLSVFPQLCQLVGVDESEIRRPIGELLARLDISKVVAESDRLRLAAEERAIVAEIRLVELEKEIQRLRGSSSSGK